VPFTVNGWSPTTIEVLQRQQQRILHRTTLLEYVLTAEQRNGARLTLGDALTELVTDISEAARTIGTILRAGPPMTRRLQWESSNQLIFLNEAILYKTRE
jgi:hypothetical protein